MQPTIVHLDNFDISKLTRLHLERSPELELLRFLSGHGVEFRVSPFTLKETVSRVDPGAGPSRMQNVVHATRVLKDYCIELHPLPQEVIAEELYGLVVTDCQNLEKFKAEHLINETTQYLTNQYVHLRTMDTRRLCASLCDGLRLSPEQRENYMLAVEALREDYARDALEPLTRELSLRCLAQAMTRLEKMFQPSAEAFYAAILEYTTEQDAYKMLGHLALKQAFRPKIKLPRFPPRGEERFYEIINRQLAGWGYTIAGCLQPSELLEWLPRLRCYAAYWNDRNPHEAITVNNLLDAVQLLYLPDCHYFSLDLPTWRAVSRNLPPSHSTRLYSKGRQWQKLASDFNYEGSLTDFSRLYRWEPDARLAHSELQLLGPGSTKPPIGKNLVASNP